MITDYLIELSGSLDVPAARRRRIIAEVEDHLQSTAAELHASGYGTDAAEREAVRRFGSAQALAQTFHEDQAARAARTAGRASVLLAALLVLIEVTPPGILTWGRAGFPAGVLGFVFGQIALVAGGLTVVRLYRARETRGPRGMRLTLVLRGARVVTACAWVTLLCGLTVVQDAHGTPPPASTISLAGLAAMVVFLTGALRRSRRRASAAGVDPAAVPTPDEDALADLTAIGTGLLARFGHRAPSARRAPWLSAARYVRRHPWRLALVVALAAGLALGVAHGVGEGGLPPVHRLPLAVLASLIIATVEGSAVLVSYLALGGYLGIRGRSDAEDQSPASGRAGAVRQTTSRGRPLEHPGRTPVSAFAPSGISHAADPPAQTGRR